MAVFASRKQSIAIWHGHRIEDHLAEWICKAPTWTAKARQRITIGGEVHEIDNLAWNPQLDLVLAVEAKRVWDNQPGNSQRDVKRKARLYMDPANTRTITSHVSLPNAAFRYFVFNMYGTTESWHVPIIAGDQIEHVFNRTLAFYIQWEQQVLKNALCKELGSPQDPEAEELFRKAVLAGSPPAQGQAEDERQRILAFIDGHAGPSWRGVVRRHPQPVRQVGAAPL
jgi:hypothetical protein